MTETDAASLRNISGLHQADSASKQPAEQFNKTERRRQKEKERATERENAKRATFDGSEQYSVRGGKKTRM